MNQDEFAFFNQQLAAMLRDGIPLEGALRQLAANLKDGKLRKELELLGADLAQGVPLAQALAGRQLPDFYRRMVTMGVAGNDLPGMLTLLGDHYQRSNLLWTRLQGLLVYPLLVLAAAFGLSVFVSYLVVNVIAVFAPVFNDMYMYRPNSEANYSLLVVGTFLPPVALGILGLTAWVALVVPGWRRRLRWRLPAFHEASLAGLAGAMSLMLRRGGNLGDCLRLAGQLESGTPAAAELDTWAGHLAAGRGKFADLAAPGRAFPPLFVWLVGHSGEDLAAGFQRAAEIYGARAAQRVEVLLYTFLPCVVVILGLMILGQLFPLTQTLVQFINMLDGVSQ